MDLWLVKLILPLFVNLDKYNITIILVYVDDIIITDNNLEKIRGVKKYLRDKESCNYYILQRAFSFLKENMG
jgi:hypothetical protein